MSESKKRGLWARLTGKTAAPAEKPVEAGTAERQAMKISELAVGRSLNNGDTQPKPFKPAGVPSFIKKEMEAQNLPELAMDSNIAAAATWAGSYWGPNGYAFTEGLEFLGYPYLAELAQRPEYRRIVEIIAQEMTRKWIRLTSADDGDDDEKNDEARADKIAKINQDMDRLKVREVFKTIAEQDGFFGRAHLYIDTGDSDDRDELKMPIGDGKDKISKTKVSKNKPILALRAVEAVWTYPTNYNSNDPLKGDWYNPDMWFVMGKQVHVSRLLPFIGRPVPDLLKPAYSFGGLAMTQMAKPYVDNWLQTRQSVNDIISAFSVFVLKTNMSAVLQGGGMEAEMARASLFNNLRNNRGLFMVDKEAEDFENVSAPLSTLDMLQAQSQEHMAAVSGIPLVKLLGIQPAGLNACLPGDTLIATDRGQVQIRDVTTDDKVLTREGFAPLTFAGITKYANELIEIKTASKTLLCTGNHPIWLPGVGEFVPAENVLRGDRLLLIGEKPDAPKTRRQSHGEGNGGGVVVTDTMQHGTEKHAVQFFSIGEFGRSIAGLCRKVSTSIIEMVTRRITNSTILSPCLLEIMPSYTTLTATFVLVGRPALNRHVVPTAKKNSSFTSCRAGKSFAPKHARLQTEEQTNLLRPSPSRYVNVSNAAPLSRLVVRTLNFVRESAPRQVKIVEHIPAPTTLLTPRSGGEQKNKTNVEMSDEGFVVSVRRIPASEWVYDLTVADGYLPEFYANDILTHNSSEGEIRVFYDTIGAYQEAFFRDHLTKVIDFIQLSLFGEVDDSIVFQFEPLFSLTEKELAEARKAEAETDQIYIDSGVVSPDEVRGRLANDEDSLYQNLSPADADDAPDLLDEEEEGLVPKGAGSAVGSMFKAEEVTEKRAN